MAKKQTRKSIRISGDVYDRLLAYATRIDRPMSRIVERDCLTPFLDREVSSAPAAVPEDGGGGDRE